MAILLNLVSLFERSTQSLADRSPSEESSMNDFILDSGPLVHMEQRLLERPKELDRMIKGLVGKWKVEARIQGPDGRIIVGNGSFEAKEVSLGRGIHSAMKMDLMNLGPYEENVVWGFDQWNNEVRNLSIISDGRIRDNTGRWIDDQTIELNWVGKQKEEGVSEHIMISMVSPNEVRGHIVGEMNGRTSTMVDYILKRT
jgi:hypothetical protein